MTVRIPETHLDLLNGPRVAALTTLMPDGQPQSNLVWCDYDGESARVNTTRQRQKGKNMLANPKVTLFIVDGYIYPREQANRETRIICRIHASKITLGAIHS
jgi:pyridoxine/pyridoxamine 5'-phosphate oxidase